MISEHLISKPKRIWMALFGSKMKQALRFFKRVEIAVTTVTENTISRRAGS
jgi:hypothetical protein